MRVSKRVIAVAACAIAAPLLLVGSANAAGPRATRVRPSEVAIAIGTVTEADGGQCTLDLRAADRGDATHGNLRFYCPDDGYSNGGVRTLTVTNGAIAATGQGGFTKTDGTRSKVQFNAQISADGQVTVAVTGAKENYTLSGHLAGKVQAGPPALKRAPKSTPAPTTTPQS